MTAPSTARVLLVDDYPANLLALRSILEPLGAEVITADSGRAAVERARVDGESLACILLDVQMPGLDGLQTAQALRSMAATRSTPILFLTAHESTNDDIRAAYREGAVDFITKPIDPEVMQAKVRAFVELHRKAVRMAAIEAREETLHFLSESSALLASSLDYERTLKHVANLAVPHVADWCTVHLADPVVGAKAVAVAHKEPAKVRWAEELGKRYPSDPHAKTGAANVIRTGQPELYELISDALLVAVARDEEHLKLLRDLGMSSAMTVPLRAPGKCIGAVTFIRTGERPPFAPRDLVLAQEVADRAGQAVENARLYNAAQQAIRLRDDFLALAGHELRTPLTPLSLRLERLVRASAPQGPDGAIDVALIAREAAAARRHLTRVQAVVTDLIDAAELSAARLSLRPERFDLAELARELVEHFGPTLDGPEIRLTAPVPVEGEWDQRYLEHVLMNLISNALKFGADKPIHLEVMGDANTARVVVRDTGIGIPADKLPLIFDKFERAVSDRNYGGLGLGLHIARRLVQQHGGSIDVVSQEGVGSTFTVVLPKASPAKA